MDLGERGDLACLGSARQVAQRKHLRARQAGAAELCVGGTQDLLCRWALVGARKKRTQAREDRRRGLAGELLVDDRLGEHGEGVRRLLELHAKRTDGVDETRERSIRGAQMLDRNARIESERAVAVEESRLAGGPCALDRQYSQLRGDAAVG